jgi:hypothetical protein
MLQRRDLKTIQDKGFEGKTSAREHAQIKSISHSRFYGISILSHGEYWGRWNPS